MFIKKVIALLSFSAAISSATMSSAYAGFVDNRTAPGSTEVEAMYKSVLIEDMVTGLVPPSYNVKYTQSDMSKKKVTLVSKGPWDVLLEKALKDVGLRSTIDEPSRTVTITMVALSSVRDSLVRETEEELLMPGVAAVPVPEVLPIWTLTAGLMIGHELQKWGQKAGWKVIWSMSKDWVVPAPTSFTGDFRAAASEVIKTLAVNGALVRAQFFDGNKTLVVTGPGVTAQ